MRTVLMLFLPLLLASACLGQSPAAKWKVATITGVKVHELAAGKEPSATEYEVTSRIENVEYVVLYAAPPGKIPDMVRYRLGQEVPVLVGTDTIKYNDMTGTTREVPILSRRTIPTTTAEKPEDKH